MTKKRWLLLIVGIIVLVVVAIPIAAAVMLNSHYQPKSVLEGPVAKAWVACYDGPAKRPWRPGDSASALAVDGQGNVYVTGYSEKGFGTRDSDYATVKYDAKGHQLWAARYDGPAGGRDDAIDIAVGDFGAVYATGYSRNTAASGAHPYKDYDQATVKYSSDGDQLWVARHSSPSSDESHQAAAVALSDSGEVYVTGDSATIKYDSQGLETWIAEAPGKAIAVDDVGNVYVTGDSGTFKYDSYGNQLWDSGTPGKAVSLDGMGNLYITGDSGTVKIDTSGSQLWVHGAGGIATALDSFGDLFVAGKGKVSKYDSNGNMLWIVSPPGATTAMAIDSSGDIYLTGSVTGDEDTDDYCTAKYDSDGRQVWIARYGGNAGGSWGDDKASAIAVDRDGNVYVTGYSTRLRHFSDKFWYWIIDNDIGFPDDSTGPIDQAYTTIKYTQ